MLWDQFDIVYPDSVYLAQKSIYSHNNWVPLLTKDGQT